MKERMDDDLLLRRVAEMKAYFHQHKLSQFTEAFNQILLDNIQMYNQLNLNEGENNEERSSDERSE